MIPENAERLLQDGLGQLKQNLNEKQAMQLRQYLKVLQHWNKVFNLTAIRDFNDMVVHHILDSLAIAPFIAAHTGESGAAGVFSGAGGACFDLGSGAGVPGIPLAIMSPDTDWTLVDSNGKKARFLNHVVRDAGLNNVTVLQERIENIKLDEHLKRPFLITARALASTADIIKLVRSFISVGDRLLLMKGVKGQDEALENFEGFATFKVHHLQVPFLDAERYLLSTEYLGNSDNSDK